MQLKVSGDCLGLEELMVYTCRLKASSEDLAQCVGWV